MNEKNIKALSELTFSDELFEKNSIEKMSNIPSRPSAFGESSLTPSQVKRRFDANANELRKKFNELLSLLPDLGGELKVDLPGITTLAALIYAINATEGTMLQDILSVSYGNDVIPLSTVVERLIKADGDNDTKIGKKLSLMSEIDARRIKAYKETGAYYFSEANWEAFIGDEASGKFGYNRVYVERSKGRGSYGMYALSYSTAPIYNAWYSKAEWSTRFAAEHPGEIFREPYDYEYPLLDSVAQRLADGGIRVPLLPINPDDAASKKYVDDKIENIDNAPKYTEGLEYILNDRGTYYICDGGDVAGDISIPPEYNGLPVCEISNSAFYGERRPPKITSVIIPATIETIKYNAFCKQINLRTVIFRGSPSYIDRCAFNNDEYPLPFEQKAVPCDLFVPWSIEEHLENAPFGTDPDRIHYGVDTENLTVDDARIAALERTTDRLEIKIGDIDCVFDEIHEYAEEIISGGKTT